VVKYSVHGEGQDLPWCLDQRNSCLPGPVGLDENQTLLDFCMLGVTESEVVAGSMKATLLEYRTFVGADSPGPKHKHWAIDSS
jgi:hypothetical protein